MNSDPGICPSCGEGKLSSEIIEDNPNGEHIETSFFSCGHKQVKLEVAAVVRIRDISMTTKVKSGNAIRGKPRHEIDEYLRGGDIDNPKEKVYKTYYRIRNNDATIVIQTVQYESGKLKHIHCKKCDNEWTRNSAQDLDTLFICDLPKKRRIVCLRCGATFDK